jgi:hypothetical protein
MELPEVGRIIIITSSSDILEPWIGKPLRVISISSTVMRIRCHFCYYGDELGRRNYDNDGGWCAPNVGTLNIEDTVWSYYNV